MSYELQTGLFVYLYKMHIQYRTLRQHWILM